ncbi:MAG TPA: MarP family serine protease [Candidatus Limnocylindrales bacterium]
MNLFDLLVLVLVVMAILIGIASGALPQIGGLLGAFAGGALALVLLPLVEPHLPRLEPLPKAILVLGSMLIVVGIGEAIGSAVGRSAAVHVRSSPFGTVDRFFGGLVGGAQALLVIWLIGGLLAAGPLRSLAAQAQTSLVVRSLNAVLPAPTEIAVDLGRLLDDTGLPDLFVGLEPLPAPPVPQPASPEAEAIARVAKGSTLRVAAQTCEFTSSGSGFAIAPQYVVTNAHVVAGADTIRVVAPDRTLYDAVPVFDDPKLDVALLWVPNLRANPLRLAAVDPTRGAIGATIGYPHGGPLVVSPAAVSGAYPAQGRDIYGEQRVSRQILELRAQVEQGDSGGPLVLGDGTVGGVVFAEARTDDAVGYALTPTAVARAVEPSIGRTGSVDTGACIR